VWRGLHDPRILTLSTARGQTTAVVEVEALSATVQMVLDKAAEPPYKSLVGALS
jgi:hypothetical protein